MKKQTILDTFEKYVMPTYTRSPVIFVKGKGMTLIDITGKKYLDFFPGWGVSNVGHCHVKVMSAVRDQIGKLIHIPNNFYHPYQAKLAEKIIRFSFPGKVFFCNSGTEAVEGAIKLARAYGKGQRYEIITMRNSFHGRTLGSLSATGQSKYQKGFGPLPQGFCCVPFNDIQALKEAVNEKTVAILLEPVQGEGGVNIANKDYIVQLRQLCDDKDILLMFDEVQTGMGRTGKLFGFQHYGIKPDVMTLAKALGGGLPIGAIVSGVKCQDVLQPGMHASTFGGSPLVCKAALGVFKAIEADKMLVKARAMGQYAMEKMGAFKQKFDCIADVRGLGLMIGIELTVEGKPVVDYCRDNGLLINCTQGNILRIMPALNVTRKQINQACHIMEQAIGQLDKGKKADV